MNQPKTLAERLKWMAENLSGFQEELDSTSAIRRGSFNQVKKTTKAVPRGASEKFNFLCSSKRSEK